MAEDKKTQTPTAPLPRTVLNLNTVLTTLIVRINDEPYELARPEELSIRQHAKFERLRDQMTAIRERIGPEGEMSDEDDAQMSDLLKLCCGVILLAPPEVQNTLHDVQRMKIIGTFLSPPPSSVPGEPAAKTETTGPTPAAPALAASSSGSS